MTPDERPHVFLILAGSCIDPAKQLGGWGVILLFGEHKRELSGPACSPTSAVAELEALVAGLEALKKPCLVTIVTANSNIEGAFTKGWLEKWKKKGRLEPNAPGLTHPSHRELWRRVYSGLVGHGIVQVIRDEHPQLANARLMAREAAAKNHLTRQNAPKS